MAQGETQTHGFQQTINTDMHAGERELILDTSEHLKAFYYLLCFSCIFLLHTVKTLGLMLFARQDFLSLESVVIEYLH